MAVWRRPGWSLGDAVANAFDRRLLRRAQANLAPVLRDGEEVIAFDPATVAPVGAGELVAEGTFVTLYLTDLALYVLDDDGAVLRIARRDFEVTDSTSSERIDLHLSGGRRFAATPAPAPSRIARILAPPSEP